MRNAYWWDGETSVQSWHKRSETLNTITKVGIAAGFIALLVWGAKAAKNAIANFTFDLVGYGKPTLTGAIITIPLQIKFGNPTPLPISIDQLIADIYIDKNGQWTLAAKINQPLTIAPGTSLQWLSPSVNLGAIFGGNVINTLNAVQQIIASKKLNVRTDVTATYQGIALPQQSITNIIDIA